MTAAEPPRDVAAVDALASFRLDGRVVLVTGASAGLGRRFVEVLHAAGATVAATARRQAPLQELADGLARVQAFPADLEDAEARTDLVQRVVAQLGQVDVLVNNAGVTSVGQALEEPLDTFSRVLDVDVTATFDLARLVAADMMTRGTGSIVNIASIAGAVGTGDIPMGAYSAAKGGVISLTRELAAQWGRHGVRVNCLSPGWMNAGMGSWVSDDEAGQRWVRRRTPLRRPGLAHELDGALLFLAGDASSFVTGQNLVVDGGWTAV